MAELFSTGGVGGTGGIFAEIDAAIDGSAAVAQQRKAAGTSKNQPPGGEGTTNSDWVSKLPRKNDTMPVLPSLLQALESLKANGSIP